MGWDAEDVALLKKLWAAGGSAAQIARRLGYSRNAVCAKLTRLDLKRGHKPPTAKPKIRPLPACQMIFDVTGDLFTHGRQLTQLDFNHRIIGPLIYTSSRPILSVNWPQRLPGLKFDHGSGLSFVANRF